MKPSNKKYHSYQITRRFLAAMDKILCNRQNGKVTASSFGETVGMTASNISRLRVSQGENAVTLEAIGRMCEEYNISPYWLLTGKGEMFSNAEMRAAAESIGSHVKDIEKALAEMSSALKILKSALV